MDESVQSPGQAVDEAASRLLADEQRRAAAAAVHPTQSPTGAIFTPEMLSGTDKAWRQIITSLGGANRVVTAKDLQDFKRAVRNLGKEFKGGITPQQVINGSHPERVKRANDDIKFSVPIESVGNRLHFITNVSANRPDPKPSRHHVHVEFETLDRAVASPLTAAVAARQVAEGRVRIGCDCEDFTFGGFRYIATIGNFVSGRPETGFPRIRSPNLGGIACKHILRTMAVLKSPPVQARIKAMIQAKRDKLTGQAERITVSAEDAEATARKQAQRITAVKQSNKSDFKSDRTAKPKKAEAGAASSAMKSNAVTLAQARAITTVAKREASGPKPASEAQKKAARSRFEASVAKMLKLNMITQKKADKMLKEAK